MLLINAIARLIFFLAFLGDERNANFDHTVINDDLEVAYEKLKGILIKVSKCTYNYTADLCGHTQSYPYHLICSDNQRLC